MANLRSLLAKTRMLVRNRRAEQELSREIASHLALLQDEFERRGMAPDEARAEAKRAWGGIEQAKQLHRDARTFLWLEQTLQDLRHACRTLRRSPGFALVAILTIALGVGVNTTLFTAYNAVALKPLPIADANRVFRLERMFESRGMGETQYAFSYPEYANLRDRQTALANVIAASWPVRVLIASPEEGSGTSIQFKPADAQLVSGNYFRALGINAAVGRVFSTEDDRAPGASPVIVLSHPYWERQFNSDPQIVGRVVRIGKTSYSILGVTPREFTGTSLNPQVPDFWTPISMQGQLIPGQDWLHRPTDFEFQILGRLNPGVPVKQAQGEIDALVRQFAGTYQTRDRTITVNLQRTAFFGNTDDVRFQAGVAAMMAIFLLVLLVACANVTNMLLARGAARQREISVRLALGASRARIIRHLLTESMLLSLAGGIAGLGVAALTARLLWLGINTVLVRRLGTDIVLSLNFNPDARILAYVLLLSLLTGLAFGLSPALQFSRPDLNTSLKDDTTSFGRGMARSRLRSLLICSQVAVSVLLLSSAGLLIRGMARSQAAEPGFETHRVYLIRANYSDDTAKAAATFQRFAERVRTLPEVANVAFGDPPMMGTWTPPMIVHRPGALEGAMQGRTLASYASENFLNTLGIALLRGRDFTTQEASSGAHVAIVSAAAARMFWPDEDPLGKHFQLDMHFDGRLTEFEVIGIARDVRFANLTRTDPAHVYLAANPPLIYPMLVGLRGDQQTAVSALWSHLRSFNGDWVPSITVWNLETILVALQRTLALAVAILAGILALLALVLAAIGIYGVMSFVVSQRTPEIGIRIALGATPSRVLKIVAWEGLRPVAIGMAIGLAGGAGVSLLLHRTLALPGSADFLYGVNFYDPFTFIGIAIFLVAVSLLASLVPSLRAVRVNPVEALRYE